MTFAPLLALLLSQTTPSPATAESPDPAARAAAAAERAAAAAERSAAAAERAAQALEKSAGLPAPAGATAPAAAAVAEPAKPPAWIGTAGVALIAIGGNASSITFNGNAQAERKWENWRASVKAFGTYGQAQAEGVTAPQIIALAAGAQARGERKVLGPANGFLTLGGETNHVKSVEFLGFGEAGVGIDWVDLKDGELQRVLLKSDLSFRYARELRFQYFPTPEDLSDRDILGPRVGVTFQYAVTKEIVFFQSAELIASLIGESRFLVNATTKLSARLTETLSVTVSFQINRDSAPSPGKVPTDTALTVGLDLTL